MMVPGNTTVLEVASLGYLTTTIRLSDLETYEVVMKEDMQSLEEIVVIGYGTARKADLTGSTTSVSRRRTLAGLSDMLAAMFMMV